MSKITWGDPGTKLFETGIDRGVLYVDSFGYAWNGLTAVTESPSGGEAKAFYADGFKYLNISTAEEFEATIEAFAAPAAFAPCDGVSAVYNGLYVGQQPRKSFGFCYRTLVGNDAVGKNYGYKIHIVYNALAAPSERAYSSTNESPEGVALSWSITTLPPALTGYKPTAYFVIESRLASPMLLAAIEDILYGGNVGDARLPSVDELMGIFGGTDYPLIRVALNDPSVPGVYDINQTDVPTDARAIFSDVSPTPPASTEDPILWFDTSAGNYAIPKLVTGD